MPIESTAYEIKSRSAVVGTLILRLIQVAGAAWLVWLGYQFFATATEPALFKAYDAWATANPVAAWALVMAVVMILWLVIEIIRFLMSAIALPDAIGRIEGKVDSIAKDLAELKRK